MSGRQDKRIRKEAAKLFDRELGSKVKEESTKLAAHFRNSIKPKPRWMPDWLYIRLLHMLLNV